MSRHQAIRLDIGDFLFAGPFGPLYGSAGDFRDSACGLRVWFLRCKCPILQK
jgi:hypothetical protein